MRQVREIIRLICLFALAFIVTMLGSCNQHITSDGEIKVSSEVIYPKYRVWTSPSKGEEVAFNSPSLQWPSGRKANYDIRLSTSKDFNKNLITRERIPFAIFNPHKKLDVGMWYWQYRVSEKKWGQTDSFTITPSTKSFVTPVLIEILNNVSSNHPRVFAKKNELKELRIRAAKYEETKAILKEADILLNIRPLKENSALPTHTGENDYENSKIAQLASRGVGWTVFSTLNSLSQAYILTGDIKYFYPAKKWMLEVSDWDPNGITHLSNFGDSGIMTGLALALDTFWDLLQENEREKMIQQVETRAGNFYSIWIGKIESRSSSMHVWQHILHQMFQTALALAGETSKADKWIEYIYELWIAQSPKMGETDGAWFNGTGYFKMNTLAMYDVNAILKQFTGMDFMQNQWYKNNPVWLIYAFPPGSVADGFCNDGDKYTRPNIHYAGYADAAARVLNCSYADWYAKEISKITGNRIESESEFRWYRIQYVKKLNYPKPIKDFDLPQAALFPDVGVAYMNTSVQNASTNLMLSVRSSPFGPLAHSHAEQNTFNIAYGGKRLFYNSGYRPNMSDPHNLAWHKHTRGHNGILIDGEGQPFNAGAYGWIPRFIHGDQISYAVGDASNAYSGSDMNESVDLGVKRFRRHYLMLRPSTIVIYDELEANREADWSWLLHNDTGLESDAQKKTIKAENELANALVSVYSSTPISFNVTDTFNIPARNWNRKVDENGNLIDFKNQWHFSGVSKEKTAKMRFLSIIQVKSKSGNHLCEVPEFDEKTKTFSVNGWQIKAELDTSVTAKIEVTNRIGTASFVSSGTVKLGNEKFRGDVIGSSKLIELIDGEKIFLEKIDEVPNAIKRVMHRDNVINK